MEPDLHKVFQYSDAYRHMIIEKSIRTLPNTRLDVETYVNHRLNEMHILSSDQRTQLIERCGGLFIFASLACDLLQQAYRKNEILEEILNEFTSLDALYHQVISRADPIPRHTTEELKTILGIIVVAEAPLSIRSIAALLPPSGDPIDVGSIVGNLGSIISIGTNNEPIYIMHATFTEFLLRQHWITKGSNTKTKNNYAISRSESNRLMARGCLSVLSRELKPNPCDLPPVPAKKQPWNSVSRLGLEAAIRRNTTAVLRYAASNWISHVIPALHDSGICESTGAIFHHNLLHWIEFGGTSGTLGQYMLGIHQLKLAIDKILKLSTCAMVSLIFHCVSVLIICQGHRRPSVVS